MRLDLFQIFLKKIEILNALINDKLLVKSYQTDLPTHNTMDIELEQPGMSVCRKILLGVAALAGGIYLLNEGAKMLNNRLFTDKSLGTDYELADRYEIGRLCKEYPNKIINNMHLVKYGNEHQIALDLVNIFETRSVLNYIRIILSKRSGSNINCDYFARATILHEMSDVGIAIRERIDIMNNLHGINPSLDREIEQNLKLMCERQPLVKRLFEYVGDVAHMPKVNV